MKSKTTALALLCLCVALAAAALVILLRGTAGTGERESVHTVMASDTDLMPEQSGPAYTGPEVKRQPRQAGAEYFADAAFVGSPIVTALEMYDYDGLLAQADFYPTDTLTDTAYLAELEQGTYGKIYIGLGAEELSWNIETVWRTVAAALQELRAAMPGTVIYVMNATPVSEYVSSLGGNTTQARALTLNEHLLEIAGAQQVYYLDVFDVLSDEDGYLPSAVTENGVSFTPAHYDAWYRLLNTRYIEVETEDVTEPAA